MAVTYYDKDYGKILTKDEVIKRIKDRYPSVAFKNDESILKLAGFWFEKLIDGVNADGFKR